LKRTASDVTIVPQLLVDNAVCFEDGLVFPQDDVEVFYRNVQKNVFQQL